MIYPAAFNTTTGPMHWTLLQRSRLVLIPDAPANLQCQRQPDLRRDVLALPSPGRFLSGCKLYKPRFELTPSTATRLSSTLLEMSWRRLMRTRPLSTRTSVSPACASERPADPCPYLTRRPRDAGDHSPKPARHDPEAIRRVPRCCQPQELDARNGPATHGSHVCNVTVPLTFLYA